MRVVTLVLMLSACGRAPAQGAEAPPAPPPRHASAGAVVDATGLRVLGQPSPSGEVAMRIEQHGEGVVRLRPDVAVEVRAAESFAALGGTSVTLRPSCDAPAPACQELGVGGTLRPPPWTGREGTGQCTPANAGRAVPPGTYRFVLTTCEGARVEGTPFTVGR